MDTLTILRGIPLFNDLTQDELEAVAKCIENRHYESGETVIQEQTPGEALFLVKSGKVRVEKHSGGKKVVLAELGPGKAVGEMSLIDSSPTSACVIAVEASDLLALGRLDLDVLLNWNPILAAKMWHSFTQMLSERLRDMNEKMLERFGEHILREP
jgi:CRP/FNR family cyclic AMP-dependent transcriptional regulator